MSQQLGVAELDLGADLSLYEKGLDKAKAEAVATVAELNRILKARLTVDVSQLSLLRAEIQRDTGGLLARFASEQQRLADVTARREVSAIRSVTTAHQERKRAADGVVAAEGRSSSVAGGRGERTVVTGAPAERGAVWGVRGPDAAGSRMNPIVVVLEAAERTPLGSLAAAVGDSSSAGGPESTTIATSQGSQTQITSVQGAEPAGEDSQESTLAALEALKSRTGMSSAERLAEARGLIGALEAAGAKEAAAVSRSASATSTTEKSTASEAALAALAAKELAPGQRASRRPEMAGAYEAMGYTLAPGPDSKTRLYGVGGEPGTRNYGYASAAEMAAAQEAAKAAGGGSGGGLPPWALPLLWGHGGGGGGGRFGWLGAALTGGGMLAGMGSLGSFAGFGPEHLLMTLGGIAGSGVAAAGGAGLLGAGALAKTGVGMGSDAAVMSSTIADTKSLYQGYTKVAEAVAEYGANSKQAKEAQAELNQTMKVTLGGTKGVEAELRVAKEVFQLNKEWDKKTSGARVQAAGILSQGIGVAKAYVPLVAEAAEQNFRASGKALKPLMAWLKGPEVMGLFKKLETEFFAEIPTGIHALDEGLHFLGKTIAYVSPLTGTFLGSLNGLLTRLNQPSSFAKWESMMHGMIEDFHVWMNFFKALGGTLFDLFKNDAHTGEGIIETLTGMLDKAREWENTVQGRAQTRNLFLVHKEEVEALLKVLPPLISDFREVYMTVAPPLVKATTEAAKGFAWLLKELNGLGSGVRWIAGLTLIAWRLKQLGAARELVGNAFGKQWGKISETQANTDAIAANTKALQDNAAAASEAAAAQKGLGASEDAAAAAAATDAAAQDAAAASGGSGLLAGLRGRLGGGAVAAEAAGSAGLSSSLLRGGLFAGLGALLGNTAAKAAGAKGTLDTSITTAGAGAGAGFVLGPAAGALIGTEIAPVLGTVLGAGIGAAAPYVVKAFSNLFGGPEFQEGTEKKIQRHAREQAEGIPGEASKEAAARSKELAEAQRAAHKTRNLTLEAQAAEREAPGLSGLKAQTDQRLAEEAKAYGKYGKLAGENFQAEYKHVKFQGPATFLAGVTKELGRLTFGSSNANKAMQKAALEQMLAYAGELEAQGTLPKKSITVMLRSLERQFPQFAAYLRRFGAELDKTASDAFKLTEAKTAMSKTLGEIKSMTFIHNADTVKGWRETAHELEALIALRKGTPAAKEYERLLEGLKHKEAAINKERVASAKETAERISLFPDAKNIASYKKQIKTMEKEGQLTAAHARHLTLVAAEKAWQEIAKHPSGANVATYVKGIEAMEAAGLVGINKGNELIQTAVNDALKKLGAKPVALVVKAVAGAAQGATKVAEGFARGGLVQFGVPGGKGHDAIPVRMGGQEIVVGSGEVGAVLTGEQQEVANAMMAPIGGLSGLFENFNRPHYMAKGGLVAPSVSGAGAISQIAAGALKEVTKAANAYLDKQRVAASTVGGGVSTVGLSGSLLAIVHQIAGRMGWSGQVQDWLNVISAESGGSMTARNEESGAYGIAQFINGPGEYAQYGGNVNTLVGQLVAMANYIKGRYGGPSAAWAHEVADKWYARGGLLGFAKGGMVTAAANANARASSGAMKTAQAQKGTKSAQGHGKAGHLSLAAFLGSQPDIQAIERRSGLLSSIVETNAPMLGEQAEKVRGELEAFIAANSTNGEWVVTENAKGEPVKPFINMSGVEGNVSFLHRLEGLASEELAELLKGWGVSSGMQSNIESLIATWEQRIAEEKAKLEALEEELRAQEREIKKAINANDAQIKKLERELAKLEEGKELPVSSKTKGKTHEAEEKRREAAKEQRENAEHKIQGEIKDLELENEKLGGDSTGVGSGGELVRTQHSFKKRIKAREANEKQLVTGREGLKGALESVKGDRVSLGGLLGVATGQYGPQSLIGQEQGVLATLNQEVAALGTGPEQPLGRLLARDIAAENEGAASELAEREKAQLEEKLKFAKEENRVNEAALKVFGGAGDIGEGGLTNVVEAAARNGASDTFAKLPAFGGSFLHGGIVPGPIGAPTLIEAHGGERVTPVGKAAPGEGHTTIIHQTNHMLTPSDPKVLLAVGHAATRGQRLQGAVQSKRLRPGL